MIFSACSGSSGGRSADSLPARDQRPISCSAATELRLQRRQLILGLVALPALAASDAVAADQSALAVVDQASVVKTWDAAEFTFQLDGEELPGILIKLADERWYASSLICPHAKCTTRYFKDVNVARDTFDVDVKNPVLGCPCHFSVFDVADGGRVIHGPAPNPPLQLAAVARDGKMIVSR
jgi:Rieske Fe-S protein